VRNLAENETAHEEEDNGPALESGITHVRRLTACPSPRNPGVEDALGQLRVRCPSSWLSETAGSRHLSHLCSTIHLIT
jgi:hypothetical protein